jgi:chemotaxis protein methyltransferase CheR
MLPVDPCFGTESLAPIAAHEFEQIRQLARQTFGLDLKDGKEQLVSARLSKLVRAGGFRSFRAYYRHVVSDLTGEALAEAIDALATNHTAFFREADHFEFLRSKIAPSLSRRDPVEVWSAASSTGEEIWSLIMTLNEALPGRRIRVLGTDISRKALAAARRATYSAEKCAALPKGMSSRYFAPEQGGTGNFTVLPQFRSMASFARLNLMERFPWSQRFPVIFCRNVMIYFDSRTQEEVARKLTACLEPGGYLFVGHAESLSRFAHSLEYVQPAVYRKTVRGEGAWTRSS